MLQHNIIVGCGLPRRLVVPSVGVSDGDPRPIAENIADRVFSYSLPRRSKPAAFRRLAAGQIGSAANATTARRGLGRVQIHRQIIVAGDIIAGDCGAADQELPTVS